MRDDMLSMHKMYQMDGSQWKLRLCVAMLCDSTADQINPDSFFAAKP